MPKIFLLSLPVYPLFSDNVLHLLMCETFIDFLNRNCGSQIFEVGDIVLLDEKKDVGATNRRQLAALYCGATSGFEV